MKRYTPLLGPAGLVLALLWPAGEVRQLETTAALPVLTVADTTVADPPHRPAHPGKRRP